MVHWGCRLCLFSVFGRALFLSFDRVREDHDRTAIDDVDWVNYCIVLLIENSGCRAGKWPHKNRLRFCSREFSTLQGYNSSSSKVLGGGNRRAPGGQSQETGSKDYRQLIWIQHSFEED